MALSEKDVEHISTLARLVLTQEEKEEYKQQLNSILEYIEKLNEVNTDNIEPTAQVFGTKLEMRDDVEKESATKDSITKNAPVEEEGYFTVPKVIS